MRRFLILVPFFYAQQTRYEWPRGFLHNLVTGWGSGLLATLIICAHDVPWALYHYALGYIAFISLYEIGYLANDTYGLKYDPTPRPRCIYELTPIFVFLFVAMRLVLLVSILWLFDGNLGSVYFLSLLILTAILVLHNCLRAVELKIITFLQLSLLRFSLPIFPALIAAEKQHMMTTVILVGLILFTMPRLLTYLDAKGRLNLPERRQRDFFLLFHGCSFPFIVAIAVMGQTAMPVALWLWLMGAQIAYVALGLKTQVFDPKTP